MFKREKDYEVATKSSLRKKDLKTFRSKISLSIHGYNDEIDAAIFGSGKSNVEMIKLRNKMNIYVLDDGLPYFIELPDGSVMPTIFACWKCVNILPCIVIYPEVSRRLISGADLMSPGVIKPCVIEEQFQPFLMKSLCSIRVLGNPLPFAVGRCCVDNFDQCIQENTGKIISIQQIYGDYLWKAFNSIHPNEGFQLVCVRAINDEGMEVNEEEVQQQETTENEQPEQPEQSEVSEQEATQSEQKVSEPEEEQVNDSEEEPIDPQKLLDYYDEQLFNQFLLGICSLTNDDLPIQTSTFYSKYIKVNIKDTSFKKQNRFFTHMYKENYIKIKEGSQQIITFINTENETYQKYKSDHQDIINSLLNTDHHPAKEPAKETNNIEILTRYKIPKSLHPLFTSMNQDCDALYTLSEARTVLNEYIARENLICEEDKSKIIFSKELFQALYDGTKCFHGVVPDTIDRKEINIQLSNRLLPYHAIKTQSQSFAVVKKGKINPIIVSYGKFKGIKKIVTQVFNLSTYEIDSNSFMKLIAKKAASSASIQITPTQEKCVQIQGNVTKQVRELLMSEYNIPSNLIEIKKQ